MFEPPIDIKPKHWEIVCRILQKHVPQYDVWAFGSRVIGKAKKYSDLDIAIISDAQLPLKVSGTIAEDFSDSDLPWRVDIVDWAITGESFRKIIRASGIRVQSGKPE